MWFVTALNATNYIKSKRSGKNSKDDENGRDSRDSKDDKGGEIIICRKNIKETKEILIEDGFGYKVFGGYRQIQKYSVTVYKDDGVGAILSHRRYYLKNKKEQSATSKKGDNTY